MFPGFPGRGPRFQSEVWRHNNSCNLSQNMQNSWEWSTLYPQHIFANVAFFESILLAWWFYDVKLPAFRKNSTFESISLEKSSFLSLFLKTPLTQDERIVQNCFISLEKSSFLSLFLKTPLTQDERIVQCFWTKETHEQFCSFWVNLLSNGRADIQFHFCMYDCRDSRIQIIFLFPLRCLFFLK